MITRQEGMETDEEGELEIVDINPCR
ncbi:unnamed protein product, partial [Allacma fusca]